MSYINTGSTYISITQNVVTRYHIVLQEGSRYLVPRYHIVLQVIYVFVVVFPVILHVYSIQ